MGRPKGSTNKPKSEIMTTPNEIELIKENAILKKQTEDAIKMMNNKAGESGGKGKMLVNANLQVYSLNKKVNAMKAIIIGGKVETMIRALAKVEENAIVSYKAFEGYYINKKGVESKCYYSVNGNYSGVITNNSQPPILKVYIKYNENDWKWNDEGYLYYDGEEIIKYGNKTTTAIKMTKYI